MEILERFPRVFCFPKSRITENSGNDRPGDTSSLNKGARCLSTCLCFLIKNTDNNCIKIISTAFYF